MKTMEVMKIMEVMEVVWKTVRQARDNHGQI
jgi:hypothetical protein